MIEPGKSAAQKGAPGYIAALARSYFKTGDIIIIALLLTLSAALGAAALLSAGREKAEAARTYAVISRGGEELARLPLDTDAEYIISESDAYNVVIVSEGKVYMSDADCPDRLCVSNGAVNRPGQVIVCLPNRVAVSVETEGGEGVDSVAY